MEAVVVDDVAVKAVVVEAVVVEAVVIEAVVVEAVVVEAVVAVVVEASCRCHQFAASTELAMRFRWRREAFRHGALCALLEAQCTICMSQKCRKVLCTLAATPCESSKLLRKAKRTMAKQADTRRATLPKTSTSNQHLKHKETSTSNQHFKHKEAGTYKPALQTQRSPSQTTSEPACVCDFVLARDPYSFGSTTLSQRHRPRKFLPVEEIDAGS